MRLETQGGRTAAGGKLAACENPQSQHPQLGMKAIVTMTSAIPMSLMPALSPGLGLMVVAAVGRTAVVGNSGNDRIRSGREIKLMPKTAFRRSVLAQLNGFHRLAALRHRSGIKCNVST